MLVLTSNNWMNPITVDVIFPVPQGWGMCLSLEMIMAQADLDQGPHQRGQDEYPPEWQADFQRLSDIIIDLSERYQSSIIIRTWDPHSLQGLWKSVRFGVRRYPAFIVAGHMKITGWDTAKLEQHIQALVNESNS